MDDRDERHIALALRSRNQSWSFNTQHRHVAVALKQWVCYVTGERFLMNGDDGLRIGQDGADIRVTVTFDEGGVAEQWFRVYVPRIREKPIWVVPLPATRGAR